MSEENNEVIEEEVVTDEELDAAFEEESTPVDSSAAPAAEEKTPDQLAADQAAADKAAADKGGEQKTQEELDAEAAAAAEAKLDPETPEGRLAIREKEVSDGEAAGDAYWGEMLSAHPDAEDIVDGSEFQLWLKDQPEAVKQQALSGDVKDGVAVVAAFKVAEAAKGGEQKTAEQLAADEAAATAAAAAKETGTFDSSKLFDAISGEKVKTKDADGNDVELLISDVAESFPELPQMLTAMFSEYHKQNPGTAPAAEAPALPEGLITADQLKAAVAAAVAPVQFSSEVRAKHSDFDSVSKDKKFGEWLEKKSDTVKRLWKEGTEQFNAGDANFVLDAFKSETAKNKQVGKHKKKNDLHGSSARQQPRAGGGDGGGSGEGMSEAELDVAFAEGSNG